MKKLFPLAVALPLVLTTTVHAAILLSDDFSSSTSGFGWALGDPWEGLQATGVVVGSGNPQQSFRAFASPINASTFDKIYIALDFTQAGDGNAWGGASFFDGASGGGEQFFIGDPGNLTTYGIDGYVGPSVNSGLSIQQGKTVRLIAELDFNATGPGTPSTYRFWVDSFDLNAPTAQATGGAAMQTIASIRLASDTGNGPVTFDNLVVATSASDVGLIPEPTSMAMLGVAGAALGIRRRRR